MGDKAQRAASNSAVERVAVLDRLAALRLSMNEASATLRNAAVDLRSSMHEASSEQAAATTLYCSAVVSKAGAERSYMEACREASDLPMSRAIALTEGSFPPKRVSGLRKLTMQTDHHRTLQLSKLIEDVAELFASALAERI